MRIFKRLNTKNSKIDETYFTQSEAKSLIGTTVEANKPFKHVYQGSKGTVTQIKILDEDKWVIEMKWLLPATYTDVALLGRGVPFLCNRKTVIEEYSKSEYEKLPISPSTPWEKTPVGDKKYRHRTSIAFTVAIIGAILWAAPLGLFSGLGFWMFVFGTIGIFVNGEKFWNPKNRKK